MRRPPRVPVSPSSSVVSGSVFSASVTPYAARLSPTMRLASARPAPNAPRRPPPSWRLRASAGRRRAAASFRARWRGRRRATRPGREPPRPWRGAALGTKVRRRHPRVATEPGVLQGVAGRRRDRAVDDDGGKGSGRLAPRDLLGHETPGRGHVGQDGMGGTQVRELDETEGDSPCTARRRSTGCGSWSKEPGSTKASVSVGKRSGPVMSVPLPGSARPRPGLNLRMSARNPAGPRGSVRFSPTVEAVSPD